MVHALGYSQTFFDLSDVGRLCRGRERWIEPWEADASLDELRRLVISGAAFTDDSAADALRGVHQAGVDLAELVYALFPGATLLAFMEDGHPADIPDAADGVELYEGHRAGGRTEEVRVRWRFVAKDPEALRLVLGEDPVNPGIRGMVVLPSGPVPERLEELLFLLTGFATLDSPPALFQPMALPELLAVVPAVLLLHRDKNGVALGVYAYDLDDSSDVLQGVADAAGALLVRFAIPPMLARWDRALADMRADWNVDAHGPFPVPVCESPLAWEPRRRRRDRRRRDDEEDDGFDLDAALDVEDQPIAAAVRDDVDEEPQTEDSVAED